MNYDSWRLDLILNDLILIDTTIKSIFLSLDLYLCVPQITILITVLLIIICLIYSMCCFHIYKPVNYTVDANAICIQLNVYYKWLYNIDFNMKVWYITPILILYAWLIYTMGSCLFPLSNCHRCQLCNYVLIMDDGYKEVNVLYTSHQLCYYTVDKVDSYVKVFVSYNSNHVVHIKVLYNTLRIVIYELVKTIHDNDQYYQLYNCTVPVSDTFTKLCIYILYKRYINSDLQRNFVHKLYNSLFNILNNFQLKQTYNVVCSCTRSVLILTLVLVCVYVVFPDIIKQDYG